MSDQVASAAASEPSAAASAPESGGDPFGIGVEQAEAAPATEAQNVEMQEGQPTEPSAPEEALDPKYQGKTPAEIARMHQEAEKAMHQRAQEAAELRKMIETMQTMVQQMPQQQAQTPPAQAQEPRYFHELPQQQQEDAAKYFAQEFGDDPLDAVYKLAVNQPFTIDQHLQKSQVLNNLIDNKMQQYFNQAFEQRKSVETHFANHVQQFMGNHPDFKEYEADIAKFLNFSQENGLLNQMVAQKIDPLDYAYHYIKGYKAPQLQKAAAEQAQQTAEAQARERQSGFQLGQKPTPKPTQSYDPFDLFS